MTSMRKEICGGVGWAEMLMHRVETEGRISRYCADISFWY